MTAQDNVSSSERAGQLRLSGTEDSDDGDAKERGEMHCPGIVGQK